MAFPQRRRTSDILSMFLTNSDSSEFTHLRGTQRKTLLGYILAAETDRNNAVEEQIHQDKERMWQRWLTWLGAVGCDSDPFLTRFERTKKARMVGAFAVSLRRGEHSHQRHKGPLVAGTVNKAISNLAASFQECNQADPRKTDDNETDKFITSILKSFRKSDPKEKPKKRSPQLF